MHALPTRFALLAPLALMAVLGAPLPAVEVDDGAPAPIPAMIGTATLHLELLGRGLIPIARVAILNQQSGPLLVPRTWTYEVMPQRAILDDAIRAQAEHEDARSFTQLVCAPDQRVFITLSPRRLFNDDDDTRIRVPANRGWGHDHELDLRVARLQRNSIAFVRLTIAGRDGDPDKTASHSDWERIQVPDVPMDLPMVRFTGDSRKLVDPAFTRAAQRADAVFTATASGPTWTRILTLDAKDPLAKAMPQVLLDGKSFHVFDDGVPCRFAITGMHDGRITADARVVAMMPLR